MNKEKDPNSNKARLRAFILLMAKIKKKHPIEVLRELQYQLKERELAKKN